MNEKKYSLLNVFYMDFKQVGPFFSAPYINPVKKFMVIIVSRVLSLIILRLCGKSNKDNNLIQINYFNADFSSQSST